MKKGETKRTVFSYPIEDGEPHDIKKLKELLDKLVKLECNKFSIEIEVDSDGIIRDVAFEGLIVKK